MSFSQWETLGLGEGAKLRSGIPYPVIDAHYKKYFTFKNRTVAIKKDRGDPLYHIQVFGHEDLKQIASNELELAENGMVFESALPMGDSLYILYNWWDDEKKKERLYARRIDTKNAEVREPKKILEVDGKLKGKQIWVGFLQRARKDIFNFYPFENGKGAILTYRRQKEESGQGSSELLYSVLDEKLREIRTFSPELPFSEDRIEDIKGLARSSNSIYRIAEVSDQKGNSDHYQLLRSQKGKENFSAQRIELDDRAVNSVSLFSDPQGEFFLCGTYTRKESSAYVKGSFSIELDSNGDLEAPHRYKIPLEMMIRFEPEKTREAYKKKGRKHEDVGLFSLNQEYVHFLENGDRIVVGQEHFYSYHSETRYTRSSLYEKTMTGRNYTPETTTNKVERYQDIVVMRITPNGELKWMKHLPIRQVGGNLQKTPDLSFEPLKGKEKLHLLYMENAENKDLGKKKEPKFHTSGQGGVLTSYSVDKEKGDVTKNWILDIQNLELPHVLNQEVYQFGLNRIMKFGKGSFAFEVYKKENEDLLIGVELKD